MGNMGSVTRAYWIHALTPLHVGAGQGIGYIDLPITREKVTQWPLVPGSAVKGVIADYYDATEDNRKAKDDLRAAFGMAGTEQKDSNAGALVFTDARLVCLPVRSFYGTFAWCTSPTALRRLARDLAAAGHTSRVPTIGAVGASDAAVPGDPVSALTSGGRVYLEDLDFAALTAPWAGQWAEHLAGWVFPDPDPQGWRAEFRARLVVLPDDVFNFLSETATEVSARIRIDDERKTAAGQALWYEESLPAETILAGLVWCDRSYDGNRHQPEALVARYCSRELALQIGGKATVGKGRVRCVFPHDLPPATKGAGATTHGAQP